MNTINSLSINIIISDPADALEYEIQLDQETFFVAANASLWIPAEMMHASNVISGSGYFIAIRLNSWSDMERTNGDESQ